MSKYELDELGRLWRLQRLTVEQAVGQLTLHTQDATQQVPIQTEAVVRLKERFYEVERGMARLMAARKHL